jgi:hypothetical protein
MPPSHTASPPLCSTLCFAFPRHRLGHLPSHTNPLISPLCAWATASSEPEVLLYFAFPRHRLGYLPSHTKPLLSPLHAWTVVPSEPNVLLPFPASSSSSRSHPPGYERPRGRQMEASREKVSPRGRKRSKRKIQDGPLPSQISQRRT